uniref:Cytochrome c oxidase subunit 2 n=1 Tax=Polytoxus fuscovittatus TaxID=1347745 RepID=A0A7I6H8H3_9HEMI|nr:cytochrome c oxidase subunit II [Polytoxus fuscovittatus]
MPNWLNLNLQDSMTPQMEQMIMFHDHTMMLLIMIMIMIIYMMSSMKTSKFINKKMTENQNLEFIWTIMPATILMFIAIPSLNLLYLMDEINNPTMTIKSIGHQWYWSYEYSDFKSIEFNSYMKPTMDMEKKEFRLLEVDNRIIMPMKTLSRIIITSTDVIHSWTIPSLGIKIDAMPGRLNQGSFNVSRPGVIYGQCSEICGANHSFMPIVMEIISYSDFIQWLKKF